MILGVVQNHPKNGIHRLLIFLRLKRRATQLALPDSLSVGQVMQINKLLAEMMKIESLEINENTLEAMNDNLPLIAGIIEIATKQKGIKGSVLANWKPNQIKEAFEKIIESIDYTPLMSVLVTAGALKREEINKII